MRMRNVRRVVLTLLIALALAVPASAQSQFRDHRVALQAVVGPSFANVGTTFATTAGLDVKLNDRAMLVGEFGMLSHAPFGDASEIAAPIAVNPDQHVNAYHWNGNLRVRPFEIKRFEPYVTGGFGAFMTDTIMQDTSIGGTKVQDLRRTTDFATNVGAGLNYRLTDWLGVGADYRTFFVHREDSTPRVNRFTAGLNFSLGK
jgi:opacity protein-like surface antigen